MPQDHAGFEAAPDALANPLKITAIYLAAGILWAVLSDLLLRQFPGEWQIVNRLVFILVTAGLFYFLGKRHTRALAACVAAEQESAARAKAYLESAPEGIVAVNREGRIAEVNPAAARLFGYREEELTGQPAEILLPERFRDAHPRRRRDFFAAPRSGPVRGGLGLAGRRKDGTELPLRISLSYVPTAGGGLAVASVVDLSEELAVEREARRTETMTALGAVAAGIAHELNNPLAVISSRLELMLATGSDLPAKAREDLEVLLATARRASGIVNDMLAHVRQRPRPWKTVALNHIVGRALLLVGRQMRRDGIEIETRMGKDLPPVSGDPIALEEVLVNLLMNARDAMPNGGTVQIHTEAPPARPGWVRLVVRDNGAGMAPEVTARLFNRFFTTKPMGTGLGLWLSQRIILQHRGDISVQSEPGKGAAFEIALRAEAGSDGTRKASASG